MNVANAISRNDDGSIHVDMAYLNEGLLIDITSWLIYQFGSERTCEILQEATLSEHGEDEKEEIGALVGNVLGEQIRALLPPPDDCGKVVVRS